MQWSFLFSRVARSLGFAGFLVFVLFSGSGCLDVRLLVLLEEDGTGTLSLQGEATRSGLRQFSETIRLLSVLGLASEEDVARSLGLSGGSLDPDAMAELYSEEAMREMASGFGDGVSLVRHQAIRGGDKQGFSALYRFQDINRVRLGPGGDPAFAGPDWFYSFSHEPGRLRIVPPARTSGFSEAETATALDPVIHGLQQVPNADGFVQHLFAGGHAQIDLRLPGPVRQVEPGPIPAGGSVTLVKVDADRTPGGSTILRVLNSRTPADLQALYEARLPGVTLYPPNQVLEITYR